VNVELAELNERLNRRSWRTRAGSVGLFVLLIVIYRWCRTLQEGGHDWGDDFSLYIRQAQALGRGNVGQVMGDTHFSVHHSNWPYSPDGYPWAWPILLMPVVARWGVDYGKLKMVVTVVFIVFLWLFHRVCRRRMGEVGALLLVLAVGVNFFFLSWTNNVLSEFPFMAATLLTFVMIDRYQRSGSLWNPSIRPAVFVGLSMALAANVRREAFALPLGLVIAHAVEFFWPSSVGAGLQHSLKPWRNAIASIRSFVAKAAVPYAVFAVSLLVWQIVLPTDLFPNSVGVKPQNFGENARWYHGVIAEHTGLKDPGDTKVRFAYHSPFGHSLGPWLLKGLLLAVILGVIVRVLRNPREDAWLVGCLAGIGYVVFAAPFHDGRYLYALSPWALYFAAQSVHGLLGLVSNRFSKGEMPTAAARVRRVSYVGMWIVLGTVVWSNWPATSHALDYHRTYSFVENGPESPASKEMFAAVERNVPTDDVILFFRSRAMMLYTERRAVQNTDIDRLRRVAQWYVMEKDSTYGQTLIKPGEEERYGVVAIWENERWILWKFLPRENLEMVDALQAPKSVLTGAEPSVVVNPSSSTSLG
jgi:hypothetical protein